MRYTVSFDNIINKDTPESKEKHEQIYERKHRKTEWEENSQIVEGVPGRCMIVERSYNNEWIDKELVELWKNDPESILYKYNDIRCLSGTAGYVLKMKDGKRYTQVTLVS